MLTPHRGAAYDAALICLELGGTDPAAAKTGTEGLALLNYLRPLCLDNALQWMVDELRICVPEIVIQEDKLKIWGSPAGIQHCEVQTSKERMGLRKMIPPWPSTHRSIDPKAKLHGSVLERFALKEVPHCRNWEPYRPNALRRHEEVAHYFTEE